jgi:hypothetical protein
VAEAVKYKYRVVMHFPAENFSVAPAPRIIGDYDSVTEAFEVADCPTNNQWAWCRVEVVRIKEG